MHFPSDEETASKELERLRARLLLVEQNYRDLMIAARIETELTQREIEKIREVTRQAVLIKIDRILRRTVRKSVSLLSVMVARLCKPGQLPRCSKSHLTPIITKAPNDLGGAPLTKEGPALLLVLPATVIGGAERLLSAVVAHLARKGWRVAVLTTDDPGQGNGDSKSWFEKTTNEIFQLPPLLGENHRREFIKSLIESISIEVVWIAGSAFLYNMLPFMRTRFPELRVADILFNTVGHTESNRKFAQFIDLNFVENNEVLQFLLNAGESADRILKVSSGIDLQEYEPGPREHAVTSILRVAQDELIVGFSGRWAPEKDPLIFVEIARRLSHLPIHFVMTGAGPLRPSIETAIAMGGLSNRFHLIGEVEDVRPWIRSYDLLILPSRLDGRPVVVLEALALGVPVIASAVGGLPELVEDGVNGFLCVPGMSEHFVRKIALVARDPELLLRMKRAARSSAEQNLDSREMLVRYEEALRGLAQAGGQGKINA
jgi:glycosyltransferase involved in cell wall biosynthesis